MLLFLLLPLAAVAGEAPSVIPPGELQALDRAITRELNSGQLGSQTLGDLTKLKHRLLKMQETAKTAQPAAVEPVNGADESVRRQLQRLEAEAQNGGRAARKSLALYYLFLNEPEKALAQWRQMGRTTDHDLSYFLVASYLELALGEYNSGRNNLETAMRLMDTRTSLALSTPVFCQTIGGYRIYVPRPEGGLLPGEEVLIYVEVEGVVFNPTPEGGSECRVMFGMKLKDDHQGTVLAEPNYGEYAPLFSGPIRDLHAALTWRIPNDLEPGRYHLTIEAVEDATKRRGEAVVGFTVGKRETNPEKRPTAGPNPANVPPGYFDKNSELYRRQIQEAQKSFPGASTPAPNEPRDMRDPNYYKQFEMLQQFERDQKVDR